jgi:hypothetical protein
MGASRFWLYKSFPFSHPPPHTCVGWGGGGLGGSGIFSPPRPVYLPSLFEWGVTGGDVNLLSPISFIIWENRGRETSLAPNVLYFLVLVIVL